MMTRMELAQLGADFLDAIRVLGRNPSELTTARYKALKSQFSHACQEITTPDLLPIEGINEVLPFRQTGVRHEGGGPRKPGGKKAARGRPGD